MWVSILTLTVKCFKLFILVQPEVLNINTPTSRWHIRGTLPFNAKSNDTTIKPHYLQGGWLIVSLRDLIQKTRLVLLSSKTVIYPFSLSFNFTVIRVLSQYIKSSNLLSVLLRSWFHLTEWTENKQVRSQDYLTPTAHKNMTGQRYALSLNMTGLLQYFPGKPNTVLLFIAGLFTLCMTTRVESHDSRCMGGRTHAEVHKQRLWVWRQSGNKKNFFEPALTCCFPWPDSHLRCLPKRLALCLSLNHMLISFLCSLFDLWRAVFWRIPLNR